MANPFNDLVMVLEMQLAEALRIVTENGDLDQIERILELKILKEKLIEELIGELCQPQSTTFENTGQISINGDAEGPAAPYPSEIVATGLDGAVRKVSVTLYELSHTWPDDLDILLVGPDGQKVMLMSDAGGSSDLNNVVLTFDDMAPDFLPDSGQIVSGRYKPTDYQPGDSLDPPAPAAPYATELSVFNGTVPNGTWSLFVFDDAGGDRGRIAQGWDLTITTNPCVLPEDNAAPAPAQVNGGMIDDAVFNMEYELSRAFQVILDSGDPDQIERFIKLLINKELLLLLIRDEVENGGNGNGGNECPCKFRIGIQGNAAPAVVRVTQTGQPIQTLSGTINVSAEQCFTGARKCNPAVDQFNVNFGDNGNTINFTQGNRSEISCENGTVARVTGPAQAVGNILNGNFTVSIEVQIDQNTDVASWNIMADSVDGTAHFETSFTSPVSARTFIGDCDENVSPN